MNDTSEEDKSVLIIGEKIVIIDHRLTDFSRAITTSVIVIDSVYRSILLHE